MKVPEEVEQPLGVSNQTDETYVLFRDFALYLRKYFARLERESYQKIADQIRTYDDAISTAKTDQERFEAYKAFIHEMIYDATILKEYYKTPVLLTQMPERSGTPTGLLPVHSFYTQDTRYEPYLKHLPGFKARLHKFYMDWHKCDNSSNKDDFLLTLPEGKPPTAAELDESKQQVVLSAYFEHAVYEYEISNTRMCLNALFFGVLTLVSTDILQQGWDGALEEKEGVKDNGVAYHYWVNSADGVMAQVAIGVVFIVAAVVAYAKMSELVRRRSDPVLYDVVDAGRVLKGGLIGLGLGISIASYLIHELNLATIEEQVYKKKSQYGPEEYIDYSDEGVICLSVLSLGLMLIGGLLYGYKDSIQGRVNYTMNTMMNSFKSLVCNQADNRQYFDDDVFATLAQTKDAPDSSEVPGGADTEANGGQSRPGSSLTC